MEGSWLKRRRADGTAAAVCLIPHSFGVLHEGEIFDATADRVAVGCVGGKVVILDISSLDGDHRT